MLGIKWFNRHPLLGKKVQASMIGLNVSIAEEAYTKTIPLTVVGYLVEVTDQYYYFGDTPHTIDLTIDRASAPLLEEVIQVEQAKQEDTFDVDVTPTDPYKFN